VNDQAAMPKQSEWSRRISQGAGTVIEQRPYHLIRRPKPIADRQFEIEFLDSGVELLAFTFI
jgi:hypothetical protein